MTARVAKLAFGSMILALGITNVISGQDNQKTPTVKALVSAATKVSKLPYRHQSHFLTSIEIRPSDPYTFPSPTDTTRPLTVTATFNSDTSGILPQTWDVYSQSVGKAGKRLFVVLVAKHPSGRAVDATAQAAGTGTLTIATTDPNGGSPTTTSTGLDIEPMDPIPAP